MTARSSIDPGEFLHEHLAQASPNLLRQLMEGGLLHERVTVSARPPGWRLGS